MELISNLEQFKLEILKLNFENVNDLSNVASLNTPTYQGIIRHMLGEVITESQLNNVEAHYLVEIRKQWQLHLFFLDTVRIAYSHKKFKKLPRPKDFNDKSLPAYIELLGSVVPSDNPFVTFDEQQQQYYQYLEFAKKLEGAMIVIEYSLSEQLSVKTNFERVKDIDPGFFNTDCKFGDEFMISLVKKEIPDRIREINEAELFVRGVLNPVYENAKPEYYNWIVKSMLKFPFPEIEIPEIGQEKSTFVVPYEGFKESLYNKIKYIKRKIYQDRTGSDYLATIFNDSTINFNDDRVLQIKTLMNKI